MAERLSASQGALCHKELIGVDTEFSAGNSSHKKSHVRLPKEAMRSDDRCNSHSVRMRTAERPVRCWPSGTEAAEMKHPKSNLLQTHLCRF
jgi:hypothetical protein